MSIPAAHLEDWYRERYFTAKIDLGASGVQNYSFAELRRMTGLTPDVLDELVLGDTHSLGGVELREAMAARWAGGDPGRIMATLGSTEALYLVQRALLEPGDEVIVPDPAYASLDAIAEASGCRVRRWRLRPEDGFAPDVDELVRMIGPDTRMVVLNFPHNPTGVTITRDQQLQVMNACEAVGAYLLWDGAFTELALDSRPLPDPAGEYPRAISTGTFSKAYGLPGLRVGWCVAAPEILDRCVRLRDYVTLFLSPLVELVARYAAQHAPEFAAPRLEQAHRNRAVLREWLSAHEEHLVWTEPAGGVTLFPRMRTVADPTAFADRLERERGVVVVPGHCFGHPAHLRLGFGMDPRDLAEGLDALSDALTSDAR
ncbi:capreomycidine synthase [Streptomyces sp. NPDC091278]|uniref:capreomycidine synthase n=1 Tax=Streptomyces sp. NPDC091278 TaxID=3155301 RepID=UPI00344EB1D5